MTTEFAWDESKADANFQKHGITFEEAVSVFENPRRSSGTKLTRKESLARSSLATPSRIGCCSYVSLSTIARFGSSALVWQQRRSGRTMRKASDRSQERPD